MVWRNAVSEAWEADERSRLVELALGQNPGRKPEGHQRALAREALSLGEQSSSCRASLFVAAGRRAERLER
jgi:hypothetical protein